MTTDRGRHRRRAGPAPDRAHPGARPGGRRARHHHRHRHRVAAGPRRLRLGEPGRPGADLPGARRRRRVVPPRPGDVAHAAAGSAWRPATSSARPGAVLAVVAGVVGSMLLLLVGAALLGSATAANSGARYAATDLAPEATRARALSIVVWATTIGAVVGPNLTGPSGGRRRPARHPRADRPVRARRRRDAARRRSWSASCCAPTRCCVARELAGEPPADAAPARPGAARGRRCASARCSASPSPGWPRAHAAMVGGDGDDPAAHGARRRRAAGHRDRDQRPRARHVRVLAAGRLLADRLGRAPVLARRRRRSCCVVAAAVRAARPRAAPGRSSPGCSCSASAGRSRRSPRRR